MPHNTHSSCPTMLDGGVFYEVGEGDAPLEALGTLTLSVQLAESVATKTSGLILYHQHAKVKTRKSAKVGVGVSSLEIPRTLTMSEQLTEHVAERASGLILHHQHPHLGDGKSVEVQELPDWIESTLTREEQQATLDAYENAPENLKHAVKAREKILDAGLKAETSFVYFNRRWYVNLRGCSRAIFDPQLFINKNHPREMDGVQPGCQKVEEVSSFGSQYYINSEGANMYIANKPHIQLGDMDDATAQAYSGSLWKLLGVKFTGSCTPHDSGNLNKDPIEVKGIGHFAELRLANGKSLHIEVNSAGVRDGFERWGRSLFLQARSSEV